MATAKQSPFSTILSFSSDPNNANNGNETVTDIFGVLLNPSHPEHHTRFARLIENPMLNHLVQGPIASHSWSLTAFGQFSLGLQEIEKVETSAVGRQTAWIRVGVCINPSAYPFLSDMLFKLRDWMSNRRAAEEDREGRRLIGDVDESGGMVVSLSRAPQGPESIIFLLILMLEKCYSPAININGDVDHERHHQFACMVTEQFLLVSKKVSDTPRLCVDYNESIQRWVVSFG
jgi:hypothetical protein